MTFNAKNILKECQERGISISRFYREYESQEGGSGELERRMLEILGVMEHSACAGLKEPLFSLSGMTGGFARKVWERRAQRSYLGEFVLSGVARALSTSEVNASMGKIAAAPTAGAAGILPAALLSAQEKLGLSREELLPGLYTAAAVGRIIALSATVSGADGGCQAECGSAAAMAAAALTELMGGTPAMCFDAAGYALIHVMGLVCDPIAGFVEYPCSLRNASGLVNAFVSADLALAGIVALVPFDEVVEAMYRVGKMLPEALRETARGGIASSETARKLERQYLFGTKE